MNPPDYNIVNAFFIEKQLFELLCKITGIKNVKFNVYIEFLKLDGAKHKFNFNYPRYIVPTSSELNLTKTNKQYNPSKRDLRWWSSEISLDQFTKDSTFLIDTEPFVVPVKHYYILTSKDHYSTRNNKVFITYETDHKLNLNTEFLLNKFGIEKTNNIEFVWECIKNKLIFKPYSTYNKSRDTYQIGKFADFPYGKFVGMSYLLRYTKVGTECLEYIISMCLSPIEFNEVDKSLVSDVVDMYFEKTFK